MILCFTLFKECFENKFPITDIVRFEVILL